jgi:hypothetical protein
VLVIGDCCCNRQWLLQKNLLQNIAQDGLLTFGIDIYFCCNRWGFLFKMVMNIVQTNVLQNISRDEILLFLL